MPTPSRALATLLRRMDLPGPLGDATKAIVGAGETVAGAATGAAGTANVRLSDICGIL